MITQKRGLSAVVVTVLIILLALAAVAIIWAAVRPAIQGAGEQISGTQDCLNLDLEITACSLNAGNVETTVKRNVGGGTSLDQLRIVVDGSASDTGAGTAPSVLESISYDTGVASAAGNSHTIEVGGILNDGTVCQSIAQAFTCNL